MHIEDLDDIDSGEGGEDRWLQEVFRTTPPAFDPPPAPPEPDLQTQRAHLRRMLALRCPPGLTLEQWIKDPAALEPIQLTPEQEARYQRFRQTDLFKRHMLRHPQRSLDEVYEARKALLERFPELRYPRKGSKSAVQLVRECREDSFARVMGKRRGRR